MNIVEIRVKDDVEKEIEDFFQFKMENRFAISFPYEEGVFRKVSYIIKDNRLFINIMRPKLSKAFTVKDIRFHRMKGVKK